MIFILHYILFNAGLCSIIILLTLFLQTYSDASLTEIGTLLMVLPFLSIITKPLFCALADRQQAHRQYMMGSLFLMVIGYCSLVIAPFYPDFVAQNGRLVWYCDVAGIIVGFSAFGVAWSLGDALAVNAARVNGVTWGYYRVWATVSWGLGGFFIGLINETPLLPKYVPAFLVLGTSCLIEILCMAVYPARHFDMTADTFGQQKAETVKSNQEAQSDAKLVGLDELEEAWPAGLKNGSLKGTLSGTARLNPRHMGAMANVFMEDIGSSLRSSFSLGQGDGQKASRRLGLAELLEQHQLNAQAAGAPLATPTPAPPPPHNPASGAASTFGRAALLRAQTALARMNSLSAETGHAIADCETEQTVGVAAPKRPQMMIMSSVASNQSLGRAAAARALAFGTASPFANGEKLVGEADTPTGQKEQLAGSEAAAAAAAAVAAKEQADKFQEDLQLVLLKLILKRDTDILKYLLILVIYGVLFIIHIAYFFMHVEQLCREKGYDFSTLMGIMTITHSCSEVFCFLVLVPYYMPKVGRFGSILTCALIFAIRYSFYGTYFVEFSPYYAIITETCHGFAYGITYSLITEIAGECVDRVDHYLPELIERGLVHPNVNPNQLKLPLRATMYGLFSGAFDGLGNGLGALIAGIYLDSHSFTSLWLMCTYLSLAIAVIYPLTEWRSLTNTSKKANCN